MGLLTAGCATSPFRITEVSPGIFIGQKPTRQEDFTLLRARGVRTVLSLELWPWDIWPERRQARRNGTLYQDVPLLAFILKPREASVKKALLLLHDPSLRPILVHCYLGEDRTAFIIGLYRIYFEGWTAQAAWEEMLRFGFHVRFTLRGYTTYFWSHTQTPAWARSSSENPAEHLNTERAP